MKIIDYAKFKFHIYIDKLNSYLPWIEQQTWKIAIQELEGKGDHWDIISKIV